MFLGCQIAGFFFADEVGIFPYLIYLAVGTAVVECSSSRKEKKKELGRKMMEIPPPLTSEAVERLSKGRERSSSREEGETGLEDVEVEVEQKEEGEEQEQEQEQEQKEEQEQQKEEEQEQAQQEEEQKQESEKQDEDEDESDEEEDDDYDDSDDDYDEEEEFGGGIEDGEEEQKEQKEKEEEKKKEETQTKSSTLPNYASWDGGWGAKGRDNDKNASAAKRAQMMRGGSVIGMRKAVAGAPSSPRRASPLAQMSKSVNDEPEEETRPEEKGSPPASAVSPKVKQRATPRGFFSPKRGASKGQINSPNHDAIHEGWLHIRRTGKGSFKKYWFVVTFGEAVYYPDSACKAKKGGFELKKSTCRLVLRGSATDQCIFGLNTQNKEYDLKAEAVDDVTRWMRSLEAAFTNDMAGRVTKDKTNHDLPSSNSTPTQKTEDLSKFEKLIDFVTNSENEALLDCICQSVTKKDEKTLAVSLVHTFELRKSTFSLLKKFIAHSVGECNAATTLFRGNSLTEKALTVYCHLVGTQYLQRCLKPLFLSVVNSDADYEIDPSRVSDQSVVETNIVNLLSVSQMFMAKITASKFTNVPYGIRNVCRYLADSTQEKFPDGLYSIIGGLFFLRFVCPALLVPQELGIWDGEMQPEAKRALLLISKTLMNLSNGVKFGKKEQFMTPMNDFIVGNEIAIKKFFDSLILKPEDQDEAQREDEKEQLRLEEKRISAIKPEAMPLKGLRNFISTNFEQIKEKYLENEEEDGDKEEKLKGLKEVIDLAA